MADILIENRWDWAFDGTGKWDFYTDDYRSQSKYSDELFFWTSSSAISILGTGFKYKKDGQDENGSDQYNFTAGTVTGFAVDSYSSHTYVSERLTRKAFNDIHILQAVWLSGECGRS